MKHQNLLTRTLKFVAAVTIIAGGYSNRLLVQALNFELANPIVDIESADVPLDVCQPLPYAMSPAALVPLAAEWAAVRHQYDPGYDARVQRNHELAVQVPVPVWLAMRRQYDPGYEARLQSTGSNCQAKLTCADLVQGIHAR